jgi:hypothetical protein
MQFPVPTRDDVSPANQAMFDALKGQRGMDPNRYGGVPLSPRNAARPRGGGARLALFAGPLFIALGVGSYTLASLAQCTRVQPSAPTLGGMAASWRSFSTGCPPQSRAGLDRRRNGLRVGHVTQTGADAKARQAVADEL